MKVKVKIVNLNEKKILLPSGNKRRGRYHENNYLGSDKWASNESIIVSLVLTYGKTFDRIDDNSSYT